MDNPFFQNNNNMTKSKVNDLISSSPKIPRNLLIGAYLPSNPWNRGLNFTDSTVLKSTSGRYMADRWMLLSDGNYVVDVTKDELSFMRLTVSSTGENKKMGVCQMIRNETTNSLLTTPCSLSFIVSNSGITHVKIAILSWTGATNLLIYPISSWGATGFDPVLTNNWEYLGVSFHDLVSGFETIKLENIVIPASSRNIAVAIWCDDTSQIIHDNYISIIGAQFENNKKCTPVEIVNPEKTLLDCKQYYFNTYANNVQPGTENAAGGYAMLKAYNYATSFTTMVFQYSMWKVPAIGFYSYDTGTVNKCTRYSLTATTNVNVSATEVSENGCMVYGQSDDVCGNSVRYRGHAIFEAELGV